VNNANPPTEKIPFVRPEEVEWLRKYREQAFEVMVACHELLGHGSGRLLVEHSPGVFNFDIDNLPLNPLTGQSITSWYKPNETWASVFGADANAIEECRADGVSLILLPNRRVLSIFGFSEDSVPNAEDSRCTLDLQT
jgi:dipeptidyl-peptidase III